MTGAQALARMIEQMRRCEYCGRTDLTDDEIGYGHDCEDN